MSFFHRDLSIDEWQSCLTKVGDTFENFHRLNKRRLEDSIPCSISQILLASEISDDQGALFKALKEKGIYHTMPPNRIAILLKSVKRYGYVMAYSLKDYLPNMDRKLPNLVNNKWIVSSFADVPEKDYPKCIREIITTPDEICQLIKGQHLLILPHKLIYGLEISDIMPSKGGIRNFYDRVVGKGVQFVRVEP